MESGLKLTSTEFGAKMSVRVHANVMYYAMGGGGGGGGGGSGSCLRSESTTTCMAPSSQFFMPVCIVF